jgi:hypothetical protein
MQHYATSAEYLTVKIIWKTIKYFIAIFTFFLLQPCLFIMFEGYHYNIIMASC